MSTRKIVHIDQSKCDGCGQCVPSCAEGAIQVINGKARLVSDVYCDGLGACLGECPQGAITIIEREAAEFDEHAALEHVARTRSQSASTKRAVPSPAAAAPRPAHGHGHGGCPGAAARSLGALPVLGGRPPMPTARPAVSAAGADDSDAAPPLANWPIQLHLVPPTAPFLRDADLFLVADCAAFAFAGFHREVLKRRPLVIGCPKLDDTGAYVEKLSAMIAAAGIRSITVVHMEVPCCTGLIRIAQQAKAQTGSDLPLEEITVSIRGELLQQTRV